MYTHSMPPKKLITFRIDPDKLRRLDEAAVRNGFANPVDARVQGGNHGGRDTGRSAVLTHLIDAYIEGRCLVLPQSGANPFPAEEIQPGDTPFFPLLVSKP